MVMSEGVGLCATALRDMAWMSGKAETKLILLKFLHYIDLDVFVLRLGSLEDRTRNHRQRH